MAMLVSDTRAMWESISQLTDSDAKDELRAGAGVRRTTAVAADPQRRASEGSPGSGNGAPVRKIAASAASAFPFC